MRRFYKEVTLDAATLNGREDAFCILLDGKAVKTPMRRTLALPTQALAEAVADEWRAQGDKVMPHSMPLTKLANTAIDRVPHHRDSVVDDIVAYSNDLLCYRAEAPEELVARQNAQWNPLLDWAAHRYGANLTTGVGVNHIDQPDAAVAAIGAAVMEFEVFALTALHAATTICGSVVLALALADGRLNAEEAFALSQLDERFQVERWGEDEEAAARTRALAAELVAADLFLRLSRG